MYVPIKEKKNTSCYKNVNFDFNLNKGKDFFFEYPPFKF